MSISLQIPASRISLSLEKSINGDDTIILRPLALTDAPYIVEAIDESLTELRRFMPWAHFPQTVESQRARIITAIYDYWSGKDYALGVFGNTTNRFLGGTGFHRRTLNSLGLEVGYWMRSSMAGQGLATAVTRSLIVYGFEYLGLKRVQCGYNSNNVASSRVNDKCGFKIEGTFRNFESMPTEEMVLNGWQGDSKTVLRGLCPEDIPNLGWYRGLQSRLAVYDWLGQKAET